MDFMIKIERPEKGIGTNAECFARNLKMASNGEIKIFTLAL